MLSFASDYIEGAHEKILQRFLETNMEQLGGYGSDPYCESAKAKIKEACNCPEAEIFFISGGTQTNLIVIDSLLKPYEGVISAETGHIHVHEAGSIECCGHKILALPQKEGKIIPAQLEKYLETFFNDENHDHMVFPGMVYVSHPTEYGTLYTKEELTSISNTCKKYNIPLFMDGARLGYGLMSKASDMTLADIASLCDVFYIGGTKVGALLGEAVVFTKNNMPKQFLTMVKMRGGLLAKGRVLGIQFDTLFTDNLYFDISKHAIEMADILKAGLKAKNIPFFIDSPTNQIFVILEDSKKVELEKKVVFSFWEKYDDTHTVIRFATSWATKKENIDTLLSYL